MQKDLLVKVSPFWILTMQLASAAFFASFCFLFFAKNEPLLIASCILLSLGFLLKSLFEASRVLSIRQDGSMYYTSFFTRQGIRFSGSVNIYHLPFCTFFNRLVATGTCKDIVFINAANVDAVHQFIKNI